MYDDKAKSCCLDTESFIINIKTNDFYKDKSKEVKGQFDALNYEAKMSFPVGEKKSYLFHEG